MRLTEIRTQRSENAATLNFNFLVSDNAPGVRRSPTGHAVVIRECNALHD
jgi:hypothetical protein